MTKNAPTHSSRLRRAAKGLKALATTHTTPQFRDLICCFFGHPIKIPIKDLTGSAGFCQAFHFGTQAFFFGTTGPPNNKNELTCIFLPTKEGQILKIWGMTRAGKWFIVTLPLLQSENEIGPSTWTFNPDRAIKLRWVSSIERIPALAEINPDKVLEAIDLQLQAFEQRAIKRLSHITLLREHTRKQ